MTGNKKEGAEHENNRTNRRYELGEYSYLLPNYKSNYKKEIGRIAFCGTYEDNLKIAKQNASQAELEEACKMASVHDFIVSLPMGYKRSSEKLGSWFKNTKLYKNNLESYIKGQGMTRKAKIRVMITVTLMMSFGFFMMFRKDLYIPCAILAVVWLFHILYFSFEVKG